MTPVNYLQLLSIYRNLDYHDLGNYHWFNAMYLGDSRYAKGRFARSQVSCMQVISMVQDDMSFRVLPREIFAFIWYYCLWQGMLNWGK